jgi:hypothetical protein
LLEGNTPVDIFFEIQKELLPALRSGDLFHCEREVAKALTGLPGTPFHAILDLSIGNSPTSVAAHFDGFFHKESAHFKLGAAYCEISGFGPGHWDFDVLAFTEYGGHDDYDWLARFASEYYPPMRITGFELLQDAYSPAALRNSRYTDARLLAELVVVIKFQDLIRRAARQMRLLAFPLLVSAHDFDFIFEIHQEPQTPP